MERALSQDERIRRAEEIYYRRQNIRERRKEATVNVYEQKNYKVLKRVIVQAVICSLIYCIFYLIDTTNYSFSEATLNITEELISREVDFLGMYNNFIENLSGYIPSLQMENKIEENKVEENIINEESLEVSVEAINVEDTNNVISEEKTENADEKTIASDDKAEDIVQEKIVLEPLSETDRIKKEYSFILPAKRMDIIRIWRKNRSIAYCIKIS